MNRISTFIDADAAQMGPEIDSEMVLGFHLKANNIAVSLSLFLVCQLLVQLFALTPEASSPPVLFSCGFVVFVLLRIDLPRAA